MDRQCHLHPHLLFSGSSSGNAGPFGNKDQYWFLELGHNQSILHLQMDPGTRSGAFACRRQMSVMELEVSPFAIQIPAPHSLRWRLPQRELFRRHLQALAEIAASDRQIGVVILGAHPHPWAGGHTFHEGLAVVSIYRVGVKFYPQAVIDRAGAQVFAPFDVGMGDFREGLARVYLNENMGFIDKTGKPVIPPKFRDFDDKGPSEFYEGLAAVSLPSGRSGYINQAGRMVVAARFGIACPFVGGIALVFERGRIGYIDRTGKYIWSGSTEQTPNNEEPGCF